MSMQSRREEILRRMAADPLLPLVLARAKAVHPRREMSRPPDNGLTEIIIARISQLGSPSGTPDGDAVSDTVPDLQDPTPPDPNEQVDPPGADRVGPTQNYLTTAFNGRLVRADEPNLNGAVFTGDDLRYGLSSLAGAPMTWNHVDDRGAYGWIDQALLAEHPDYGNHVQVQGRFWTGRFPDFAQSLVQSLQANQASLSMECMAQAVGCMSPGCNAVATDEGEACPHILQKSAPRRMINPTFFGAGVILDGVKPGWPDASLVLKS